MACLTIYPTPPSPQNWVLARANLLPTGVGVWGLGLAWAYPILELNPPEEKQTNWCGVKTLQRAVLLDNES